MTPRVYPAEHVFAMTARCVGTLGAADAAGMGAPAPTAIAAARTATDFRRISNMTPLSAVENPVPPRQCNARVTGLLSDRASLL
jgi:hypothetical protein